ncbi:LysR family transcriptional regulator [Mameliella alba]|uniref:LysR family transcriptional regulator n=1 Tax=Mameliella alba TaxID=561184 RepID=UPI000AAC54A2|nr:LysR family transcriptional regulator [Mameliella alba]
MNGIGNRSFDDGLATEKRMHARVLTYVDEVARQGSIRAAADKLNVAASAISRQIKSLEDDLGTPIFNRAPRSLTLTAAGEILLVHIRETLREMDRNLALIEDLKGLRRGEVSVVLMSGLASNIVPRVVMQFRKANPKVAVRLQLMTDPDEMIAAVAEGQSDLAIGFDFPPRPNVRQLAVAMVNLGVVVPPDHPFAGRSSVRLDECADYTMVVADTSMVIRPHLEKLFARSGGRPSDLIETNSIEMMRHLTRLGGCITFLTPFDIETEVAAGQLAFVPVEEFARETQRLILLGPDRNPSALGSVLAEHFRAALG